MRYATPHVNAIEQSYKYKKKNTLFSTINWWERRKICVKSSFYPISWFIFSLSHLLSSLLPSYFDLLLRFIYIYMRFYVQNCVFAIKYKRNGAQSLYTFSVYMHFELLSSHKYNWLWKVMRFRGVHLVYLLNNYLRLLK